MRKVSIIATITLVLSVTPGLVFAQQSDYKIKKEFESKHSVLESSLYNAASVYEVDSLKNEIEMLSSDYEKFQKLLNNALYPSSYNYEISSLQKEANVAEQRLLIIENQSDRLFKLGVELSVYKNEIAFLSKQTDSLRKAITTSQESEERLAALVKRYRNNLEQRDELIMDVIDSLMLTYSSITTKKVNEIADGVKSGRISGSDTPLTMIESILEENVEFTSTNTKTLSVEDHLRMYAVQHHFSDVWDQIGPQLIDAYGGNEKDKWAASIDQKIKDWRMSTSQKMWNSMDQYLEFSNVDLEAFDNNYSFFIALDNFVKEAEMKSKEEILSSESYAEYKKFEEFWSGKIKNEWSNLVQDSELLTVSQISTIDEQLSSWEAESRPIHPFLIVLIVLTIISLLGFSLTMFKAKRT